MLDCAIVGTGPAAISAALTLKNHHKNFIVIGFSSLSEKIHKAELITNYPGLSAISGPDFARVLNNQLKEADIAITEGVVTAVQPMGNSFALLCGADFYEAKTVILATGTGAAPTIEGEERLVGRGVSYCATCDGNLYRGKRIFVYCESSELEHEVTFLASLAERVFLYTKYSPSGSFPKNVQIIRKKPTAVTGEARVEGVQCGDESFECDGVFFLKSSFKPSALVQGLELSGSFIKVGREMETSIPGLFAAGDATGAPFQYAKAVGEGNVAAHSAVKYLALAK